MGKTEVKEKSLHIIKLILENVGKIKAIEITPDKNGRVSLTGKNEAGKSTVINAIQEIFGKSKSDKKFIKDGEDSSRVVIELEDYLITELRNEGKSPRLKVTRKDGEKIKSAKTFLKNLLGDNLDPFEIALLAEENGSKFYNIVKDMSEIDVDVEAIESEIEKIYEQRKEATVAKRSYKKQFEDFDFKPKLPKEPISVMSLQKEIQEINEHNSEIEKTEKGINYLEKEIVDKENEIKRLRAEIEEKKNRVSTGKEKLKKLGKKKSTEEISSKIENIEEENKKIFENNKYYDYKSEYEKFQKEEDRLTGEINKLRNKIHKAMETAKFPVKGMTIENKKVLIDGIPIEQCSDGQRIKIGCEMIVRQEKPLKIIAIRKASLLDSDNLNLIYDIAKKYDHHVWAEFVGECDDSDGIYIEDGYAEGYEIKEDKKENNSEKKEKVKAKIPF